MQKIPSSADRKQLDEVYSRVYRTLKGGITIGGRRFEFLAFGNSQLRDHGCYMFNSDEHLTAEMIREWMGMFDEIKSVAKYAGFKLIYMTNSEARLGQCFSTTRPIVEVDAIEIPDIEHNGYCFSDGVVICDHAPNILRLGRSLKHWQSSSLTPSDTTR